MSSNTPNLGLLKKDPMVDGNETFNIETMLNENWDKVDEAVGRTGGYGVTTQPKANEYEVNLKPAPASLTAGIRVTVKINVASSGAPMLNVNGLGAKPVLKTSGSSASFKQDGVYTLVYDGQAFILQGEGGEVGTATAADVLAPKTIGTDSGIVTGTIPTQGNQFKSGLWSNPDGDAYVDTYVEIDSGYYPTGSQVTIQAHDPDLLSRNIRAGVNILGVAGNSNVVDTSDATAVAGNMQSGTSGYVKGQKVTGNLPLAASGSAAVSRQPGTAGSGNLLVVPPKAIWDGAKNVVVNDSNFKQENIRFGYTMFGLVGTMGSIKKVTRGEALIPAGGVATQAPISGIDWSTAALRFSTYSTASATRNKAVQGYLNTSGNNILFLRSVSSNESVSIYWEVIEYTNVLGVWSSRGISRATGGTHMQVTLPYNVNPQKCLLFGNYYLSQTYNDFVGEPAAATMYFGTNSSTSSLYLMGDTRTMQDRESWEYWAVQVVEFW
ncbi:hypothetical protein [Paenibacillus lautus]|uniref:hypothetical protein n=1 Tax=Paenibacillus lautus TaxID=1401 RepID=UPI001C7DAC05|nr:hypothetical protein [Paenibacillus lautus]MBX4146295.1 hypothetical protein [Paenibacillus lautus]